MAHLGAMTFDGPEYYVEIPGGIDERGIACLLVAEEVAEHGHPCDFDLFDDHRV
jgi:hypothetical protein